MTSVWIYVNTSKPEHLKVFADPDTALPWFRENEPEGVAFEYGVIGEAMRRTSGSWDKKTAPARGKLGPKGSCCAVPRGRDD